MSTSDLGMELSFITEFPVDKTKITALISQSLAEMREELDRPFRSQSDERIIVEVVDDVHWAVKGMQFSANAVCGTNQAGKPIVVFREPQVYSGRTRRHEFTHALAPAPGFFRHEGLAYALGGRTNFDAFAFEKMLQSGVISDYAAVDAIGRKSAEITAAKLSVKKRQAAEATAWLIASHLLKNGWSADEFCSADISEIQSAVPSVSELQNDWRGNTRKFAFQCGAFYLTTHATMVHTDSMRGVALKEIQPFKQIAAKEVLDIPEGQPRGSASATLAAWGWLAALYQHVEKGQSLEGLETSEELEFPPDTWKFLTGFLTQYRKESALKANNISLFDSSRVMVMASGFIDAMKAGVIEDRDLASMSQSERQQYLTSVAQGEALHSHLLLRRAGFNRSEVLYADYLPSAAELRQTYASNITADYAVLSGLAYFALSPERQIRSAIERLDRVGIKQFSDLPSLDTINNEVAGEIQALGWAYVAHCVHVRRFTAPQLQQHFEKGEYFDFGAAEYAALKGVWGVL